jgi:hypothetical protein
MNCHQLLGLGKGPVHHKALALLHGNASALGGRVQALGRDQHAGPVHLFVETHVGLEEGLVKAGAGVGGYGLRVGLGRDDESHKAAPK